MLQKISDRIQGWIAGVIIAVIAGVFVLWGVEYYIDRGNDSGSTSVATVNGKKITKKQVNQFSRQLQARLQAARPNQPITPQQHSEIKSLALQQLVSKTALLLAAEKQGFTVSQQEIQQIILQAPEFQVNGLFSPQRFQQFLLSTQLTESQFLNEIRGNFLMNQVAMSVEASGFVLPNELKRAYQLIYQKRQFGYFILPLSRFLKNVHITDQAIQTYYRQHKQAYRTPEKVQMDYLLLSPDRLEKTITISPSDIKTYYQTNMTDFIIPKQWKVLRIMIPIVQTATPKQVSAAERRLQKIQQQIKKGQSFQSAMKEAGLISSSHLFTSTAPATIMNVLVTLAPGQVSAPFHTDHGVNLIKLVSVSPRKVISFEQATSEIHKRLARQQAQQILLKKSDLLSSLTYTNPNTLDIAAKKLGLTVQTSPVFTKEGVKKGVFSNRVAVVAAFSNDVLQNKNNSNPIDLPDGSVIVMRVRRYLPSRVQTLAEVKKTIQTVLTKNKAASKTGLQAYQISVALSRGTSPQVLAQRYSGLHWVTKTQVQRDSKASSTPILAAVFSTVPAKSKTASGVNTLVLANGNYVVLKVMSVTLADPTSASAHQLETLRQQLARLTGNLAYRLYGKSVIDHSKIIRLNKPPATSE